LGINGQTIPVITDEIDAAWVSESGQKPASTLSLGLKTITPKKIAAIAVVSAEVVRANPAGYVEMIRPQIAKAFAKAFDSAVLHGTSTPFATYLDQTTKAVELGAHSAAQGGVWADLNSALQLLAEDSKRLTGFVFDDIVEPTLNFSVDSNGRPIFVDTPLTEAASSGGNSDMARRGRVMGRETYMNRYVATTDLDTVVGYAGDWSKCVWGVVGGLSYDVSDQAAVTINGSLVSLWERNLVAIRAEAEYGFVCESVDNFVRLSNLTGS
jgi:HK97 family phage major capsid protein